VPFLWHFFITLKKIKRMLKMNAGVWIGIIGGIIGLAVGVGAVVATGGSEGKYIALGMLLLFGGVFYLLYRLIFKPLINTARLQKTGIPARATILEVKDTGVTINNSPQVKLILELKNSFGQKYTTQTRVLVSRINPNAYMPGMEIPVKIDPKNEQNVVLDFSGGATATISANTAVNQSAVQSELEQIERENEIIRSSGKPARAIIKKNTFLGVNVNGNNPWVLLELEVLPEGSSSFSASTKGVIKESSVSKFQPGCEIFVKYDFYDNSKVSIDHS